jgi:CENP-Q, a CENPA-CAD centromere complex subunit
MEMSLVPDLKLIATLEKEIEREKELLEEENEQLDILTKNAAREESSRKQQLKKVCPKGGAVVKLEIHGLLKENVASKNPVEEIKVVSEPLVPAYDVAGDNVMSGIVKDLSRHLTTLNGNLKEMKEIRVWINRAEEALGGILERMEGSKEVDAVYGEDVV